VDLLALPPVRRALIAIIVAGAAFPLSGVLVLEMNLITLRFALMHGALLGGAIAVAVAIDPMLPTIVVGAVLVASIGRISRRTGQNPGLITAMLMTVSIAAAAAIVYRFNVPAKDTLALIWGNVYALRPMDLFVTIGLGLLLFAGALLWRRQVIAVLYDPEIAYLAGVNEPVVYYAVLGVVALTVAVAMRLVGALLLDVFILLPALAARQIARSGTQLVILASVAGLLSGVTGFFLSIALDIPVSTAAAAPAVLLIGIAALVRKKRHVPRRISR
jgi:zinc transport system permease protein